MNNMNLNGFIKNQNGVQYNNNNNNINNSNLINNIDYNNYIRSSEYKNMDFNNIGLLNELAQTYLINKPMEYRDQIEFDMTYLNSDMAESFGINRVRIK